MARAPLTDHNSVDNAMADFDALGRELFLLKRGFPELNDAFVVTGSGRYDVRALFAAAYEYERGDVLAPNQVRPAAAAAFTDLGYVVVASGDQNGRRRYASIDAALADHPLHPENAAALKEFLRGRDYAEFYIPASGAYIGMKPRSGKPAHYVARGYIAYREDDGRLRGEKLPVPVVPSAPVAKTARVAGAPRAKRAVAATPKVVQPERVESFCPTCFLVLPATGVCANCD